MATTNTAPHPKQTPPYVAYKTFINFIDSLKKAIPARIDRSVMHTMSGGTQSHISHALRTMDLITDTNAPTEALRGLVLSQEDGRKQALLDCLAVGYPFLFEANKIDLASASGKQLLEQFENVGLRGDSIRRSIAFFLAAAKDAGMTLSPYFERIQSRSGTPRPRNGGAISAAIPGSDPLPLKQEPPKQDWPTNRSSPKVDAQNSFAERILAKLPDYDASWPDDVRRKWFDAFERLIKGSGM